MSMTRGRWILIGLLAGSITAAAAVSYQQWPRLLERFRKQSVANSTNTDQVASTPPFSTREPDRYQATRIITSDEANGTTPPGTQRSLIARDGENRREESRSGTEAMTVFLQTGSGTFLLFPARKLFADLNDTADEGSEAEQSGIDFSPNRLLHETSVQARYQLVGTENVDGRKTTKYRVTAVDSSSANESASVSLIWVDDELGMPIRSETSSSDKNAGKVTVELRDIKGVVDARLFELPPDYTKIGIGALRAEIARAERAAGENGGKPGGQ